MMSSPKPLEGLLVVAVEQAVAAPYCSSRLADAGARVIKVERPEGDFARGYDRTVHGESSYFVWINRSKESIALDLKATADLKHPSIAPYGSFTCADGRDIVISIQNEREWADFCREVLLQPDLPRDPRCTGNEARCAHREFVDGLVAHVFGSIPSSEAILRLDAAQTAYGNINSVEDLARHPQLRTRPMPVGPSVASVPAAPWQVEWDPDTFAPAPRIDEHGAALRTEFSETATI